MSEAESTAHSIAEAAASANPADVLLAAAAAPPLDSLSREDVAEITSEAMRAHGGTIEKASIQ
jgi:NADPH-dependent 2,4-dienoyl-CoA reductase/sulfur reductase-like enzyme